MLASPLGPILTPKEVGNYYLLSTGKQVGEHQNCAFCPLEERGHILG
jgi:hypothetical protein